MNRYQTKAQVKVKADDSIQLVVLSDASEDRMGDTIDPRGWQLQNFQKNPVLLWAHDQSLDASVPAIGKVTNLHVNAKGQLVGGMQFDMDDPFAAKVANKYKNGYMSAVSVGFKPLEYEETNKGYHFIKQELLELSCVNVPANQNALVQMRSLKDKHSKAATKLMQEYLEKHQPNKQNKENPMQERLQTVVNEMQNITQTLTQIVSQMEKTSERFIRAADTLISKHNHNEKLAKKIENPNTEMAATMTYFRDQINILDKTIEVMNRMFKVMNKDA